MGCLCHAPSPTIQGLTEKEAEKEEEPQVIDDFKESVLKTCTSSSHGKSQLREERWAKQAHSTSLAKKLYGNTSSWEKGKSVFCNGVKPNVCQPHSRAGPTEP